MALGWGLWEAPARFFCKLDKAQQFCELVETEPERRRTVRVGGYSACSMNPIFGCSDKTRRVVSEC